MNLYATLKLGLLLAALLGAGQVAAQANLEINTPGIAAIQTSMQKRHGELAPLYTSGAVGLTRDGNVALRDPALVPLAAGAKTTTSASTIAFSLTSAAANLNFSRRDLESRICLNEMPDVGNVLVSIIRTIASAAIRSISLIPFKCSSAFRSSAPE